jgi:endogenous inhibitor of DNA gyrase (YacG/DUF329 family)
MANSTQHKNNTKKCPNCAKPRVQKFLPFCSIRCAEIDLSKWLNEDYRVPIVETDDFNEDDFADNVC